MALLSQQNDLQANFYTQLVHNSLQTATSNSILGHIKSVHDLSTQIDATAEIMITTLGKIPNEMYYLEDTTAGRKIGAYSTESRTIMEHSHTTLASIETVKSDEYSERSTLLIILLTTLLIILFMCCVTACIIARSRSRHAFLAKSDVECSPDCGGVNQPLLDKASDATTRTSSTKN
ncbi:uncharacterized protein [Mycetomoellerius zeteki]|uniref:uncharacterized protein isoform X2 n=1 Tax=Mycetomoellerius zeteki TaxID=64791 RepID=UPI00084E5422|nr:PREDICTED: uncharacterized protein LOC108720872 isoform X2 [Trachymyrmex zeteki]